MNDELDRMPTEGEGLYRVSLPGVVGGALFPLPGGSYISLSNGWTGPLKISTAAALNELFTSNPAMAAYSITDANAAPRDVSPPAPDPEESNLTPPLAPELEEGE
jgi:hypothetical protein